MNLVLEKLIDQVNSGFEPEIKFGGEPYLVREFRDFGAEKFMVISKKNEIKELMVNVKNRSLEY